MNVVVGERPSEDLAGRLDPKADRVGLFGWGIVAPRSKDVSAFTENLRSGESWLTPLQGFGPSNF